MLFSEEDFERKKDTTDVDKRKKLAARMRGLAQEPKDWSRAELIDRLGRFAKFTQDKSSNICELKVKEGISMSIDEVKILNELFKRISEVTKVDMSSAGVTDDHMQLIVNEGFKNLRHLKELLVVHNQLTSSSVMTITNHFSKLSRKLEVLDVRENSAMTYEDGYRLYSALGSIKLLNGLDIAFMKSDEDNRVELNFSSKDIRIVEVGIICGLAGQLSHVTTLNLRSNRITAKGLHHIVDMLKKTERIRSIDLSLNPVTNDALDTSAVERLAHFAQKRKQLLYAHLEGVVLDAAVQERLSQALQVNRSVAGGNESTYFSKYLENLIISKAKPKAKVDHTEYEASLDDLDIHFIKKNRLPICTLDVYDKGYAFNWRPQPKELLDDK